MRSKKITRPGNPVADPGLKASYEIFPHLQQQSLFARFSQVAVQLQKEVTLGQWGWTGSSENGLQLTAVIMFSEQDAVISPFPSDILDLQSLMH